MLIPVRSDGATSSAHEWSPAVVEDLLDIVRTVHEEVLLVCDTPTSRGVANAVRALSDEPVAVLLLDSPVTRWSFHVTALATLPAADLTFAPAVVRAVDDAVRTRAVLSGVAGLADPNPGLGLHLLSWWPTTRFLVDIDQDVVRRTRETPAVESPRLVVARAGKDVLPDVERTLPADRTEITGGTWPARRWLETTEGPEDLARLAADAVAAATTAAGTQPCAVCERPVVDDACLFCAVVREDPETVDLPSRASDLPTASILDSEGVRL
ncbi:hypothetical protein [Sanguibacter antarcticus]|uniref:Uncharacterized protein n=1 Tax=Sanguibacter antarcticus TaxID=372484 RepID=A0A2A9E8Z2_9MICO|nr:hypothetical protein [Sanguibacter antarcticus]PFG34692.1 hypothetical protein ATL42_2612 [Sanguibacter antarcticus]